MSLLGTIQDGKIVLDAMPLLPDGTRVLVGYKPAAQSESFTLDQIRDLQEGWVEAYPGELEDLMQMVQDERENDLRMQIEREGAGPG